MFLGKRGGTVKSAYALVWGVFFCCVSEVVMGMSAVRAQVDARVGQAQPALPVAAQVPAVQASVPSQQQSGIKLDPFVQHLLPMLLQKQEVARGYQNIETLALTDCNAVALLSGKKLYAWDEQGNKINFSNMADCFITTLAGRGQQFILGAAGDTVIALDTAQGTCKNVPSGAKPVKQELCSSEKNNIIAAAASRDALALSLRDNVVRLQFPNDLFTLQFDYPITLLAHDGRDTFVLGNPHRKAVTIFRRHAPEVRKIPALPKVLALDKQGRLYVGAETGQLFMLNGLGEQAAWSSFSTGEQPIQFIAVYDEVILIAHEGSGLLKAFDRDGNPRYSILLSPKPVKQVTINERGTIVCVTQSGKVRRWTIDPALLETFVPLATEEKTLLYTMMLFSQKHGFSEERFVGRYPQYQECMNDIPQVFRNKLKTEYPIVHASQASQGIPAYAFSGPISVTGKISKCFGRMQQFAHEHVQLTTGAFVAMVYLALFQRPVIRKTSDTFLVWLRNFCRMDKKPRFLFF